MHATSSCSFGKDLWLILFIGLHIFHLLTLALGMGKWYAEFHISFNQIKNLRRIKTVFTFSNDSMNIFAHTDGFILLHFNVWLLIRLPVPFVTMSQYGTCVICIIYIGFPVVNTNPMTRPVNVFHMMWFRIICEFMGSAETFRQSEKHTPRRTKTQQGKHEKKTRKTWTAKESERERMREKAKKKKSRPKAFRMHVLFS